MVAGVDDGEFMHALARQLFPICRSITGNGVRRTLAILAENLPGLRVHEVPSGTRCFDWTIPDEWNIRAARLTGPDGSTVADFADSNLHIVGYSEPVDRKLSLQELQPQLHSLPSLPDAIPYVTSYYSRNWGFCLPHARRVALPSGPYHAFIDSTLQSGSLTYADLVVPGASEEEILVSTYVCHPSLANNELSGPVVATRLAQWVMQASPRRYTYRFVFAPETIGSITYLSRHLEHLKKRVVAGFNVTCVGDERGYSYLPSRHGDTPADRVIRHVLRHRSPGYRSYTFLDRGSDERQYCAPGVDLPVASLMRSKYGTYPEYHTSKDDLTLVTPRGLQGGYQALRECLEILELDGRYVATHLCEPHMRKRGLSSALGTRGLDQTAQLRSDVLCYSDGQRTVRELADLIGIPFHEIWPCVQELAQHDLIRPIV